MDASNLLKPALAKRGLQFVDLPPTKNLEVSLKKIGPYQEDFKKLK